MRYPRFALVAVLALVSVPAAWGLPQAELVLHFVEIGQGDCTLIECPNGGFILVDAESIYSTVMSGTIVVRATETSFGIEVSRDGPPP